MIKKLILSGAAISAVLFSVSCGPVAVETGDVFQKGEHCTAYRVGKRMFLFKPVTVIGKNCDSSASVLKDGDSVILKVTVPSDKFISGEPERDKHTAQILGAPAAPAIEFTSAPVSAESWAEAVKGKSLTVKGILKINGHENPVEPTVKFTVSENAYTAFGSLETSFTANGLQAPKVAGGIVANVNDAIELHFQLQSAKILAP